MRALVVTGASRGLGQHFAVEAARSLAPAVVVLVARDAAGLRATAELVQAAAPGAEVQQLPLDLGDLPAAAAEWTRVLDALQARGVSGGVLVNNAGTVGPLDFAQDLGAVDMQAYWALNVSSPLMLTAEFVRRFGAGRPDSSAAAGEEGPEGEAPSVVVNVSSLAAVQAFESWGLYCSGKAARDMFHAVVAKEQAHARRLVTLSYAPGPCDTDMQGLLRESDTVLRGTRDYFRQQFEAGALVAPVDTARKLAALLADPAAWPSGAHIDFYDEPPYAASS